MTIVSIWQLDCSESETPSARKARVLAGLPEVLAAADLVVLPELWLSGAFNLDAIAETSLLADEDFQNQLQILVDESGSCLHAGSFPIADPNQPNKFTNTSWLFRANETVSTYRKQHLFGFADGEKKVMTASDDFVVVETCLGRSGLATCYDLRFPELFRKLVDESADNFLIPAGWPAARIHHWQVLLQARAIENQAFVIGANSVGMNAGVLLGGQSMIVSPTGQTLAIAGSEEEVLRIELDLAETVKWRNDFPVLKDRRIK